MATMSDWFLAPALITLRAEVNAKYPKRDKASDGAVGDTSHAARVSDHNPCRACKGRSRGIVRAIDIDVSPDGNPDADLAAEVLRAAIGSPLVWYVIHKGKIYSRTHGWQARVYTGAAHNEHVHVSLNGANNISGDPGNFSTASWGISKGGKPPAKDPRPPAVSLAKAVNAARYPRKEVAPVVSRRIQRALNARGARLTVDGVYGPRTRAAYSTWQRRLGFRGQDADGIPGLSSLSRLGANRFRVTP